VIAAGIALLRPSIEVATTRPEELALEVSRFNPQVVISSQSEDPYRPRPTGGGTFRWTPTDGERVHLGSATRNHRRGRTKPPTVKTTPF
jgi:hypothetical protein